MPSWQALKRKKTERLRQRRDAFGSRAFGEPLDSEVGQRRQVPMLELRGQHIGAGSA